MKRYISIVLKFLIVVSVILLLFWLLEIFGIKQKLMQDKKVKTDINEGKYILTRLANDYEEYLKRKREELEKETIKLLKDSKVYKTAIEKQKIKTRLREIEKEKKNINDEIRKNAEESKEIEAKIMNLKNEQEKFSKIITEINDNYLKLLKGKEQSEAYWLAYANDLEKFFIEKNKKDLTKKTLIEEKFKTDNGKQFIIDEFRNLALLKSKEQVEFADSKVIERETKEESKIAESKVEKNKSKEERKIDESKIDKIETKEEKELYIKEFKEDFEVTDIGKIPEDWYLDFYDENTSVGVVNSSTLETQISPRCLRFVDNSTTKATKFKKDIGEHNYGQLKFYLYYVIYAKHNGNHISYITINDKTGSALINYYFDNNGNIGITRVGQIGYYTGSIGGYEFNKWNEVIIKWDGNTGYSKILVNGHDYGTYVFFKKSTPYKIQFQGGKSNLTNITIYIDDIEFTSNEEKIIP